MSTFRVTLVDRNEFATYYVVVNRSDMLRLLDDPIVCRAMLLHANGSATMYERGDFRRLRAVLKKINPENVIVTLSN